MTRGRRIAAVVCGVVALAAVATVGVLGFAGVTRVVAVGGQTQICGAKVGVSAVESGKSVKLLGVADTALTPGDRVRVHPLCVVEVVSIDAPEVDALEADASANNASAASDAGAPADGAGGRVELRWRLW